MSDDFLSGDAGDVTHPGGAPSGRVGERRLRRARPRRAGRPAGRTRWPRAAPRAGVLVAGVYRPGSLLPEALGGCARSATTSSSRSGPPGGRARAGRRAHGGRAGSAAASSRTSTGCWQPRAASGARLRLAARSGRRPAPAAALPRPLRRPLRALRARPRPARPELAQPLRVAGDAAAAGLARARDALRRDRPADRVRAARRGGALAVPRAALRLGARPALGRRRRAARLAPRRGRRHAGAPRDARPSAPSYRTADARRRGGRASWPSAPTCRPRGRATSLADAPARGPLMRLLFVAADMHRGGAERHWATLIPALARARRGGAAALPQRRGAAVRRAARRRGAGRVRCTCGGRADARGLRRALAEAGGRGRAPWSRAA